MSQDHLTMVLKLKRSSVCSYKMAMNIKASWPVRVWCMGSGSWWHLLARYTKDTGRRTREKEEEEASSTMAMSTSVSGAMMTCMDVALTTKATGKPSLTARFQTEIVCSNKTYKVKANLMSKELKISGTLNQACNSILLKELDVIINHRNNLVPSFNPTRTKRSLHIPLQISMTHTKITNKEAFKMRMKITWIVRMHPTTDTAHHPHESLLTQNDAVNNTELRWADVLIIC